MKPITVFNLAASQVTTHPVHVIKLEWTGDSAIAADRWIQVHDSATVPANGAVPIKEWQINSAAPDYKEFKNGELALANGLYICISTTTGTKTLSSDTFDMLSTELFDPEIPTGTTLAGDLTTARETLQVWTEAAGATTAKRLIYLRVICKSGSAAAPVYFQIHSSDTPTSDSIVAVLPIATLDDTTAKEYWFGARGREVSKIVSAAIARGCTIAPSQTAATYTAWGLSDFYIKAEYK